MGDNVTTTCASFSCITISTQLLDCEFIFWSALIASYFVLVHFRSHCLQVLLCLFGMWFEFSLIQSFFVTLEHIIEAPNAVATLVILNLCLFNSYRRIQYV